MDNNSQFLYSYIDELIRSQWAPWSENLLSSIPDSAFHTPTGFQAALGSSDSTNRTRAGECYRLGLINSRLVNDRQGNRSKLPTGWKKVCAGENVHTRLGYFSYIIGKGYAAAPETADFVNGLNAVACIQILLVAFKKDGRWYSTVNIFNFVKEIFEKELNRTLTDIEIRYLTGAVINTLDGENADKLLREYSGAEDFSSLHFSIRETNEELELTTKNFPNIVQDGNFNINSIDRHKAALFWSNKDRGIYSRAISNYGEKFLNTFMRVDRELAKNAQNSLLHDVLESIYERDISIDLIDSFTAMSDEFPELLEDWAQIIATLERGVVGASEHFEEEQEPEFFKTSLRKVRETLEDEYFDLEDQSLEEKQEEVKTASSKKITKKASNKSDKESDLPNTERIRKIINENYHSIFVDPPAPTADKKNNIKKRQIRKFDPAERDAKNRILGFCGEEFVVEVEKQRLSSLKLDDLAKKVKWISKDLGDGAGYDILSFDENRNPIFIEVKTTKGGANTQFYLSENELQVSLEKGDQYKLYRVYEINKDPKIFIINGPLDHSLDLKPTSYRAKIKSK